MLNSYIQILLTVNSKKNRLFFSGASQEILQVVLYRLITEKVNLDLESQILLLNSCHKLKILSSVWEQKDSLAAIMQSEAYAFEQLDGESIGAALGQLLNSGDKQSTQVESITKLTTLLKVLAFEHTDGREWFPTFL